MGIDRDVSWSESENGLVGRGIRGAAFALDVRELDVRELDACELFRPFEGWALDDESETVLNDLDQPFSLTACLRVVCYCIGAWCPASSTAKSKSGTRSWDHDRSPSDAGCSNCALGVC